jgi:branched-chain amino acid aminotransferase
MKVYLDGQFVDEDAARVSVFDAAVQHAVGLFETMRACNGSVFRLSAHVQRLIESAAQVGLTETLRAKPLCEAIELTLKKNELREARVRLTLTGGNLALAGPATSSRSARHHPSIFITATPPTAYPEKFFSEGVTAIIADPKANPFDPLSGHKTTHYWSRLRTLAQAAAAEAGEALWFTVTNHLCGGSVSNAFIVKEGQLHTPIARGEEPAGAIPSPVLPGITRSAVIELAGKLNLPVHRRMLTINDVLEADELLLTNSSWLILPVVKVEKETIGSGKPGDVTRQLSQSLAAAIAQECPAPQPAG